MKKTFRFYKDTAWFIDLPEYIDGGGDPMMLMMVSGADFWLDFISGQQSEVTLEISDEPFGDADHITYFDNMEGGRWYVAGVFDGKKAYMQMWLCAVTEFVFGFWPNVIFYKVVKQ